MADIIDLKSLPLQYKKKLEEKDKEILDLKNKLAYATQALTKIASVNDMLKVQLSDSITELHNLGEQVKKAEDNLVKLRKSLPTITIQ